MKPNTLTRPLSETTRLTDLHPSRFLKPDDLKAWKVTELTVTVALIQEEEVEPKPGQKEWKPVLYFKTKTGEIFPKGYLLSSKADSQALAAATNAETIAETLNKRITIQIASHKNKPVLRIKSEPPVPAA